MRELPKTYLYLLNWKIPFHRKVKIARGEKSVLKKNRSKIGERAHVDTENRTMKSAQHDFWSHIYILLVTGFMYYIIVNNTIFFEMTYPCV